MASNGCSYDEPIGVMLVHPHRIVLSGLQRIIDDERPRRAVVGVATDAASAALLAQKIKPDVVVLDAGLSSENDGNAVKTLTGADTRVLLMGDLRREEERDAAILRGACGVMQREDTPATLIRAIEKRTRVSCGWIGLPPDAFFSSSRRGTASSLRIFSRRRWGHSPSANRR